MGSWVARRAKLGNAARGELADYHLAHAARGELCRRSGRNADAVAAYEKDLHDGALKALELNCAIPAASADILAAWNII